MSLSAEQQRTLDAMSEKLRASEPRLAAMFAIFTRLTKNEAKPRREELPAEQRFRFRRRRRPSHRRAAGPAKRAGTGWRLALRPAPRAAHRSAAGHPGSGRRLLLRQVLIASPLAVALIIVGLVVGLNSHNGPAGCTGLAGAHVTTQHHTRAGKCPGQTSSSVSGQFFAK